MLAAPTLRHGRHRRGTRGRRLPGYRFTAIALLSLSLAGCFQTPAPEGSPTLREARRIESSASPERAQVAPAPVRADLARALRLYSLIDDTAGVIRIHLNIAFLHEQHDQLEGARREARLALQLSDELGDPAYLYRALLAVGRLENDSTLFTRALGHAGDALQRAVVLTYLGRPVEAVGLARGLSEPADEQTGDLAFVLFAYARHTLDQASAQRALKLYKRADDYVGIARSLRLLSLIAADRGDSHWAGIYEARANRVESALKGASPRNLPTPGKGTR